MIALGKIKTQGIILVDTIAENDCHCKPDPCIADDETLHIIPKEVDLDNVLKYLNTQEEQHLKALGEMVAIRSISKLNEFCNQTKQIINRLATRLEEIDFDVELLEIKPTLDLNEECIQYVLLANYFDTPHKHNVLIYGNVDVLPVDDKEAAQWSQPAFEMSQEDGNLYGRGVATSKGPVMCWIQAIEAWLRETGTLPVNVRFVIETNFHNGSHGLRSVIENNQGFFRPIDLIICPTNYWVGEYMPLITNNHSGFIYFSLEVTENPKATDNGSKSRDPMSELCLLMNTLLDENNEMRFPGANRHVLPVTLNDWVILSRAEVGMNRLKRKLDIGRLPHEQSLPDMLSHRWCKPSLTMHGIDMYPGTNSIKEPYPPHRVAAKFSIKLVPVQSLEYVTYIVKDYLDQMYRQLQCVHIARLHVEDKRAPVHQTRHSPSVLAVKKAFARIYQCKPATAENISIWLPTINDLRKYCLPSVQVMPLPFCSIHTRDGRPNESIPVDMYLKNRHLCATLLYEMGHLPVICKCHYPHLRDYCMKTGKITKSNLAQVKDAIDKRADYSVREVDSKDFFDIEKTNRIPTAREVLLESVNNKTLDGE